VAGPTAIGGAVRVRVGEVAIELASGDITAQTDVDAIVNAANAHLQPGGGVAGAVHRAAGPDLAEECRDLAPINPGECVITGGHDLSADHVIHCLGPVYGEDEPSDELLASCYSRALEIADEQGLESVAFPAISTGVFGYPVDEAAEVALRTILQVAPDLVSVRLVRFLLFDSDTLAVHERVLERLTDQRDHREA
jgi:O-acetyl-ADP-ribose deacetylase